MAYTHGTNYGYLKRRCRCDGCRAWWATYQRGYRQRRKAKTGERIKNGRFIKNASDQGG